MEKEELRELEELVERAVSREAYTSLHKVESKEGYAELVYEKVKDLVGTGSITQEILHNLTVGLTENLWNLK